MDYPDLFDLKEIERIGWYVAKKNSKGLSRDHKVSITDAIKNDYDSFYISHPKNCEIMTHSENTRKNSKSSIKYEDLIIDVEEYEINKYMISWLD